MKSRWLEQVDWEFVTATNEALCRPKGALHKPSSDGYESARSLWNEKHAQMSTLYEAVDLCHECHRLAPFCNFNGNTFAAIARNLVQRLKLPADRAHAVRSWVGHIVAGTANDMETKQFREFSDDLTEDQTANR